MEESLIEVIPHLEKRTHYLATLANILSYIHKGAGCLFFAFGAAVLYQVFTGT